MKKIEGVFIVKVIPYSTAWKSGLKDQDVILQIADKKVNSRSELVEKLAQYQPGNTVVVKILRNNQIRDITVKLQEENQL
jgi:serine protease Do